MNTTPLHARNITLALLCWVPIVAFAWCVVGCNDGLKSKPHVAHPVSVDDIREPLARIPVRQGFIKDAVPDNKAVIVQADATIGDVFEAGHAIDAVQVAQRKQLDEQAATIAKLTDDLRAARSDEEKQYRKRMFWIKTMATIGIAAGIALCFLVGRMFIAISLGCVAMLVAISVDSFISKWAEPIAGVSLGIVALIGLWHLWLYLRGVKRLVKTTGVAIESPSGMTPDLKARLDKIQGRLVQRLVKRFLPTGSTSGGST